MNYENIVVETHDRVGLIRLNRPQRMNALNDALAAELGQALAAFDTDHGISAIVITGNEKAFAAGADIGAMAEWDYQKVYADNYITRDWEDVRGILFKAPALDLTYLRHWLQAFDQSLHEPFLDRFESIRKSVEPA